MYFLLKLFYQLCLLQFLIYFKMMFDNLLKMYFNLVVVTIQTMRILRLDEDGLLYAVLPLSIIHVDV